MPNVGSNKSQSCAGSVEPVRHYSEYYKRYSETGTKKQQSWYHYMRLRNENGRSLQAQEIRVGVS
jgi:hypothetical protein